MTREQPDVRGEIVQLLLRKIENDRFPSTTMMNMVEELLTPQEKAVYARVLMEKIAADTYPSVPMMKRLMALG